MRIGTRIGSASSARASVTMLAHRLDEYLQATRLSLAAGSDRVENGPHSRRDVAPCFLADQYHRDGRISRQRKGVRKSSPEGDCPRVDGTANTWISSAVSFRLSENGAGLGTIRIEARAVWAALPGRHLLFLSKQSQADLGLTSSMRSSRRAPKSKSLPRIETHASVNTIGLRCQILYRVSVPTGSRSTSGSVKRHCSYESVRQWCGVRFQVRAEALI